MQIGVMAKRAGVTASKVRFYEAKGLLPPPARRDSGYRDYDEAAVRTLQVIDRAVRLGYTLREIAVYLNEPDATFRKAMLLECISRKLTEFDALMSRTKGRRTSLVRLRDQLAGSPPSGSRLG